jgi:hypothetical protein
MFATLILDNCPTRVRQILFLREILKQGDKIAVSAYSTEAYGVSVGLKHA